METLLRKNKKTLLGNFLLYQTLYTGIWGIAIITIISLYYIYI